LRAWRERWKLQREADEEAAREARRIAERLACHLRDVYGVRRVVLAGSLARGDFRVGSDIDLAAEGLPDDAFFRAGAELEAAAGGLHVDLVPIESATPAYLADLARDGIVLHQAGDERFLTFLDAAAAED
jgi:predicted nucleotidyltransferase